MGAATVQTVSTTLRFGPFELDPARRHLARTGEQVFLQPRQMDVLVCLVARPAQIVTKQTLTDEAWQGAAVTDNSIAQAVSGLRVALGTQPDGQSYIETVPTRGYRFLAPIERADQTLSLAAVEALLEPYRALVDGRVALESLNLDEIDRARPTFEYALRLHAGVALVHTGLANIYFLDCESTRADVVSRRERLTQAERHAIEGCRLAPSAGDAWITLALVRHRLGNARDAVAAAHKAVALQPDSWRHHVRLAEVSWGEDRLLAAHRALAIRPDLGLAHWLAATVLVARGALHIALDQLRAGCAAQDAASGPYPSAGLHWLRGLVLAALGLEEDALAAFERELATADVRHVYGREASANSWYAIGALHLRHGRVDAALAAFQAALAIVPGHAQATTACSAVAHLRVRPTYEASGLEGPPKRQDPHDATEVRFIDAAIATAVVLSLQQKHLDAGRVCAEALGQAAPGSAGWIIPVEPLLHVAAHRGAWAPALALLRTRAV